MASNPSNRLKRLATDAIAALSTLKIVLVNSGYTPNVDTNFMSSAAASEVSTTGYVGAFGGSGRKALASIVSAQDDTNDRATLDAADVTWTNIGVPAGVTARYALLIQETGSDAASPILACYELNSGSDISLNGGSLTLVFNAVGLLSLT